MSKKLAILIQIYLEKIAFGMGFFPLLIGDIPPLKAWHNQLIPRTGNLTDIMQYELHGVGCTFLLNNEFFVDFDFHSNGEFNGFDLWRLKQFALYSDDKTVQMIYLNINQLEQDFQSALTKGEIIPIKNSHLFMLKS